MSNEERCAAIQGGQNVKSNLERLYFDNMGLWLVALRRFGGLAEIDDLKQQAFLSLVKAAQTFNPEKGAFAPYCVRLIVRDVSVYLASNNALYYPGNIARYRGQLSKLIASGVTVETEQAEALGVSVEMVRLIKRTFESVESLEAYRESGGDVAAPETEDKAELVAIVQEEIERILQGREMEIIHSVFYDGVREKDIAECWGVSHQRVSELKKRALKRLRGSRRLSDVAFAYELIESRAYKCGLGKFRRRGSQVELLAIERLSFSDRLCR